MEEQQKNKLMEELALEPVPKNQRRHWWPIATIWAGSLISTPCLMTGAALSAGLTFSQVILSTVIGVLILMAYMVFQAMQGTDLGTPTVVNARAAFGVKGSAFMVSAVIGLSFIGWVGTGGAVTGSAFAQIMNLWGFDVSVPLSSIFWGLLMVATAIYGYKMLTYLNFVAVPGLVILCIISVTYAIEQIGSQGILSSQPVEPMGLFTGVTIIVGMFAVGATIASDYHRYSKNRKQSVCSAVVGVVPMTFMLIISGAIMGTIADTGDITIIVAQMGMPLLGLIILILASWTTTATDAYSCGLAITNLFNLPDNKRPLATGIAGIVGTVLAALGFMEYFIDFLNILSVGICPIAGVMIADYWVRKKGGRIEEDIPSGFRWSGIISWLLASILAYFLPFGISPINGIIISMVLYLVLERMPLGNQKSSAKA